MPYIYENINVSRFREAFDRRGRGGQFSYSALGLLFEYYEEIAIETGQPMELDVIAICCDWTEYTLEELAQDHGEGDESPEATLARVRDIVWVHDVPGGTYLVPNY